MNKIKEYFENFLSNQTNDSIWYITKQKIKKNILLEMLTAINNFYNDSDSNLKLREYIKEKLNFKTEDMSRNLIIPEFFGLYKKSTSEKYVVSPAGETILLDSNNNEIIDKQILKLYLNINPNSRKTLKSHIKIFVFPAILKLLSILKNHSISESEMKLFLYFLTDNNKVDELADLINAYRENEKYIRETYKDIILKVEKITSNVRLQNIFSWIIWIKKDDNIFSLNPEYTEEINNFLSLFESSEWTKGKTREQIYEFLLSNSFFDGSSLEEKNITVNGLKLENYIINDIDIEEKETKGFDLKNLTLNDEIENIPFEILELSHKENLSKKRNSVNITSKQDKKILGKKLKVIGDIGEELVYKYEIKKLRNANLSHLIDQVKIISIENENLGYDIVSFNETGEKIMIEVKTQLSDVGNSLNFYISSNELEFIKNNSNAFIYYLSNIKNNKPKLRIITKEMLEKLELIPINFKAKLFIK